MTNTINPEIPGHGHRKLNITPLWQGRTNGCGTTTMAMALNYVKNTDTFTREQLDTGHRENNSFTAPGMMLTAARNHGAFAEMYNNTTFDEMATHINKKHPVIGFISLDPNGSPGYWHYVLINGYRNNPDPTKRTISYVDPAHGKAFTKNFNEFAQKWWADIPFFKNKTGFNQLSIVVSNQDDLPPSRDVPVANLLLTRLNQFINGFGPKKDVS